MAPLPHLLDTPGRTPALRCGVLSWALRASPEPSLALSDGQETLNMICELFEASAEGGRTRRL